MVEKVYNTHVLLPETEGNRLTQVEDVELNQRVVAKEVWLGYGDKKENWKEISKDEADKLIAEVDAYFEEHFKAAQNRTM